MKEKEPALSKKIYMYVWSKIITKFQNTEMNETRGVNYTFGVTILKR